LEFASKWAPGRREEQQSRVCSVMQRKLALTQYE